MERKIGRPRKTDSLLRAYWRRMKEKKKVEGQEAS
jgi:hypothetical protein